MVKFPWKELPNLHIFSHHASKFDQYSVLTDKQHGFRSKHSTELQLILTFHDLANSLNSKSQTDMIIMDFSKAFDIVPHNRLLNKLRRAFKVRHMHGSPALSSTVSRGSSSVVNTRPGPMLSRASLKVRCLDRCCSLYILMIYPKT